MISTKDALAALAKIDDMSVRQTLAEFIAERHSHLAPAENKGLPCEYCGQAQKQLVIERRSDTFAVRIARTMTSAEMIDMAKYLTRLAKER